MTEKFDFSEKTFNKYYPKALKILDAEGEKIDPEILKIIEEARKTYFETLKKVEKATSDNTFTAVFKIAEHRFLRKIKEIIGFIDEYEIPEEGKN